MSLTLHIQKGIDTEYSPDDKFFTKWVKLALDDNNKDAELTLRIVDEDEGLALNKQWRNKNVATNVLSFPVGEKIEHIPELLGDIVICAPIVEREAKEQGKKLEAHWAHLTIHGILHLQGYDHISDQEAEIMEAKEIKILNQAGYANPYLHELHK